MRRRAAIPVLIILLVAFALRVYRLTEVPPGLTHDEANHGRDAINVLDGIFLFYFPLNYGSEPLYNYAVAGIMGLVGENLFSLRYVNVMTGLLAIAVTFLLARLAIGPRQAWIGTGLMAVSFWPLATSRQALRAGLLPLLITAAVIIYWRLIRLSIDSRRSVAGETRDTRVFPWAAALAFGLAIAATLHTYLASRVLWLIFPALTLYLAFWHRQAFLRSWRPVLVGLAAAGLLVIPMFRYVQTHPEAETRLEMLDGPLKNVSSGEFGPVLDNAVQGAAALFWPGSGDHFLAYNIPGRPVLNGITALFFILGLAISLWRWRRPAYALLLAWFLIGISPSLITGPEANTTRNIGALPVIYLLPAVGFVTAIRWGERRGGVQAGRLGRLLAVLWLVAVGLLSVRDYYIRWADSPDVRAAYQHTLIQVLSYLEASDKLEPTVISSVYPGAAHDPSIARVVAPSVAEKAWWTDARYALIFPEGKATQMIIPSSTPFHPAFANLVQEKDRIVLRADDLDPAFSLISLQLPALGFDTSPVNFGNAMTFLDARWLAASVGSGDVAELLTAWRIEDPDAVGPRVPPAFETDVTLFTHVLDRSGDILAQWDSLEAPSWGWRSGDLLIQVHPIFVPPETEAGSYRTTIGVYDRASGDRLPVVGENRAIVDTRAFVVPLRIDGG